MLITYYIYEITNNLDGRTYIGQRKCPKNKTPETDRYMESGTKLHIDKDDLGIHNFSKKILAVCYSQDILNILEKEYINMYREIGKAEYNRRSGGRSRYSDYWNYLTDEERKEVINKLSVARKNQVFTQEVIERRTQSIKDYWNSEKGKAQRKINSEQNKLSTHTKGLHWYNNGKVQTLAKTCPEGFVPGQLYTTPRSEESKRKTSETLRNMSPERKEQWSKHLSEARMGKKLSDSCRANISKANKGRKYYNNGEIEVMRFECPPGFVPGRCPKNKQNFHK